MLRIAAAIVALLTAAFLAVVGRHWWVKDPRMPSQGALGGAILILMVSSMVALASPVTQFNGDRYGASAPVPRQITAAKGMAREIVRATSGRPKAWCGWWLSQHLGMPLRNLWLARNWASVGSPAQPGPGVVVVWRHHVGIITGQQNGKWIVKSGNDGRRVRERPRSIAGAIAFRRV